MSQRTGAGEYTLRSPFVQLLEMEGGVRILDVFLTREYAQLTSERLVELADVDQSTVSRHLRRLQRLEIVEELEDTWPRQYQLNHDHVVVEGLLEAHLELYAHAEELTETSSESAGSDTSYTAGSPFVELFQYPSLVKILDVLLTREAARIGSRRLAELAGLDRSTVTENIGVLCNLGIVERLDEEWPHRYRLNASHPAADGLLQAHLDLHAYTETLFEDLPKTPEVNEVSGSEQETAERSSSPAESKQDDLPGTTFSVAAALSADFKEASDGPIRYAASNEQEAAVLLESSTSERLDAYTLQQLTDQVGELGESDGTVKRESEAEVEVELDTEMDASAETSPTDDRDDTADTTEDLFERFSDDNGSHIAKSRRGTQARKISQDADMAAA